MVVRRIGEPVQVDSEALGLLTAAGLMPGQPARVRQERHPVVRARRHAVQVEHGDAVVVATHPAQALRLLGGVPVLPVLHWGTRAVFDGYNKLNADALTDADDWDVIVVHDPQPAAMREYVLSKIRLERVYRAAVAADPRRSAS